MENSVGAITLFVEDKLRAKEFYARAFAATPLMEDDTSVLFRFENTMVNLLVAASAAEMIAPAAVGSGSRLQLTLFVENADEAVALLAERGVELLNGPLDRPWGQRTAAFADPDGHIWEVAQTL
jgi:catechol 2,3-dioxygenase-like lactoylglutathione lyase family enzyme